MIIWFKSGLHDSRQGCVVQWFEISFHTHRREIHLFWHHRCLCTAKFLLQVKAEKVTNAAVASEAPQKKVSAMERPKKPVAGAYGILAAKFYAMSARGLGAQCMHWILILSALLVRSWIVQFSWSRIALRIPDPRMSLSDRVISGRP